MTEGKRTVAIEHGGSYEVSRDAEGHFHCLYAEGDKVEEITDWGQIPKAHHPAIDKARDELTPLRLPASSGGGNFRYDLDS